MVARFIPTIGETGFYHFSPPFTVEEGTIQTCKAIRKISELLNEGVDVLADHYTANGLTDVIYEEDVRDDAEILFFLTTNNRWTSVPSRYLLGYPNMNGIPYRRVTITLTLPAFPVTQDFSNALIQLEETAQLTLGVNCEASTVDTSRAILVPDAEHRVLQAQRVAAKEKSTPSARANFFRNAYQDLLSRYNALVSSLT